MFTSILFLVKLLFLYLLLFYLVPRILQRWESNQTWADKFFISLVHSHLFIILAVHVLVAVKLFETISLLFVIFVSYLFYFKLQKNKNANLFNRNIILSVIKFSERNRLMDWKISFLSFLILRINRLIKGIVYKFKKHPFSAVSLMLIFLLSIYIRFNHSVKHFYFGAADPYVHLKWSKLLKANEMYVDVVYPFGFEAVISSLHLLFNLDPYIVIRYIGPLSGFFIVLGIYYVMRKNFPNHYLFAIFALLIYFISSFQFGFLWRQLSSLSMEYGAIFVLPAIQFFITYIKQKQIKYFILSLECFLLTLFIHPYAAICLFISYTIILVMYFRRFTFSSFFRTIGYLTITGIIGISPIIAGLLAGIPFHGSSIGFVTESVKTNEFKLSSFSLDVLWQQNIHLFAFVIFLPFIIIFLILKRKNKDIFNEADIIPFLLISFILVLFYKAEELGIPSIMMAYRLETFLPLFTSIVLGSILMVFHFFPIKKIFQGLFIIIFCIYSLMKIENIRLPQGDQYQYDEAVEAYLNIKKELPIQNWTIISPIEEYVLCIGYGWHYNLSDLITNLSRGEEIKFPTKDVFIFIENKPIGSNSEIQPNEVTDLRLPIVEQNLDYYTIPEYRKLLEEKAMFWIESVQKKNNDVFTVYLKTKNMTIYRIQQDPLNPIDFSSLLK